MPRRTRCAVVSARTWMMVAALAGPMTAAGAKPLVEDGRPIRVTVTAGPAVSSGGTVKFDAGALARPIVAALGAAGYRTAGEGDTVDLAAQVIAYDSGSYVGFAKTARMEVGFRLADASGATLKEWQAHCVERIGFNLQSTATRNAAAVAACYDALAGAAVEGLQSAP